MTERAEVQYLNLAEEILSEGEEREDRTGVGTYELFGPQMRYDLRDGLPVLTSKKVALGSVASELAWMLHGDTNLRYLIEHKNPIWNEWPFKNYFKENGWTLPEQGSDEWKAQMAIFLGKVASNDDLNAQFGNLGPVYGKQWRAWETSDQGTIDQIGLARDTLIDNPMSRRIIVNAWNVGELREMSTSGLPPCHMMFQFASSSQNDPETGKPYLDMKMYQRSADWFLGVPFNMVQYATLQHLMAHSTGHTPRYFTHTFGHAHIYKNHVDQVREQLSRRDDLYPMPELQINPALKDLTVVEPKDIKVVGYQSHPGIRAQVAI